MQSQNNMNKIKQILGFSKAIGLLLFFAFASTELSAQCSITVGASPCVGEPVLFNCNAIGATNFNWNFNSEGANTSACNPTFVFNTPGQKTITLSLKLANGNTCNTTLNIDVKPKPVVSIQRINSKNQCFQGNSFCFRDSSYSAQIAGTICKTTIVFDDGVRYTFSGNGPRTFCHSFGDPAGGTYGMTVELEDCNGCITKTRIDDAAVVQASLGLSFSSPRPQRCDSVQLCVTNNSTIPLSQVQSFSWNWGNGQVTNGNSTTPQFWGNPGQSPNPTICHWFKTQGPNNGSFNSTLTVTSIFGCTESFTFNASATNLIIKPVIIADRDSVCITDPEINFRLKDGPVPLGANPTWNFGNPPSGQLNTVRQWSGSHSAWGLGPYKINFSFTHQIPGCGRTVYDTILVIGPLSVIETGMTNWLIDSLRSQCVIKDTVKFKNFSEFYHNDKNMMDDDSIHIVLDSIMVNKNTGAIVTGQTYNPSIHEWVFPGFNAPMVHGFNKALGPVPSNGQVSLEHHNQQRGNSCTIRLWDFDDDYCEKCTTDTKNGVNVGKNCKYSLDTLPQHWYTPWDSLYMTNFSMRPETVFSFNRDSGLCSPRRMFSNDSVAIIRDTVLFYGDNPIGNKSKDSTIFVNIKNKVKVPWGVQGKARIDITIATRVYVPAGDTLFVDPNNGLAPNRWIGARYVTIQPGSSLLLRSKTDKVLYHYWLQYIVDTVPLHLVEPWHKVFTKIPMPNMVPRTFTPATVKDYLGNDSIIKNYTGLKDSMLASGIDSVNADAHRQKFYSGDVVRCFNVRLKHKDTCHDLECEHEATAPLALQPPSAKKLRKTGQYCLGNQPNSYGVTFILDDTKPSCLRTWAEINYDTALNKNGWVNLVGPNLTGGAASPGGLPATNPPYAGYIPAGPPPGSFSKHFFDSDIKDSITGYINVGLIIGNGMWTSHLNQGIRVSTHGYPLDCHDTIYYNKFVRFPILDDNFRIVKPKEGPPPPDGFTRICRKDTICLSTNPWNRTYIPDVAEATWSLKGDNVGKNYFSQYNLSVTETYDRFKTIHPDTPYLEHRLKILRTAFFINQTDTIENYDIRVAKVTKWHNEADITPVFDIIKSRLEDQKIDIYELTPAQLSELIWNGVGTFGLPYTGSRGCIDTTGFGRNIRFYKVADEKQSLHYRDTTLLPIDTIKGWDGKTYHAYCFIPQYSGFYQADFNLRSIAPDNCIKVGGSKKVIVGFFSQMNYNDTIICHGSPITALPQFRYFNTNPNDGSFCNITNNSLLDCYDYWRQRISEAGNPNRESVTSWDLSQEDDDPLIPQTIFGGAPYGASGLGHPITGIRLGNIPGGIYYYQDSGRIYTIRTAVGDSSGCKDTITQAIYVTAVRAKFDISQKRPQCNTIIDFFDSSFVQDPCRDSTALDTECDRIVKWTIDWGDSARNSVNRFFNVLPPNIAHNYTRNGKFKISLIVETQLGCLDTAFMEIYIPGPIPFFDTLIPRQYCVGEKVNFSNLSRYTRADSSVWIWSFGDDQFGNQTDTVTQQNDTVSNRYKAAGTYSVFLYHYFKLQVGNSWKTCSVVYPDTSNGQQAHFTIEVFALDSTKVSVRPSEVCVGDSVFLDGYVVPHDRYALYKWNLGKSLTDTLVSADTSLVRFYNTPGRYVIRFQGDVNSASTSNGKICPAVDSVILLVGDVKADFEIDSTRKPLFCFNNTSTNNTVNRWSFYNDESNIINPTGDRPKPRNFVNDGNSADYDKQQICEDYRDSLGEYWICLEVENAIGCKDTVCKKVFNDFQALIRPPNVFTPNNDGFAGVDKEGLPGNNVFNIEIKGHDKYDLVIYDRWGVKVFESTDSQIDWNGKVKNNGAECPDGTYYYILKYRFKGTDKDEAVLNGVVRLIR